MLSLSRTLLAVFASLALLLSPAPSQALAAPVHSHVATKAVTVSKTEWKAAGYVTKARNKAVSRGGSSMNYRKMKGIFGTKSKTKVDWRRQMGAAFRQAGGKIKHISTAESKAVEVVRRRLYDISPLTAQAECHGKRGTVVISATTTHKYYDSCETLHLIYDWGGCIGAMTFLGKFTDKKPQIDIPRYFIASFCTFELAQVKAASDASDIHAIYLRTYKQEAYMPYPNQVRYYIEYSLKPQ
jgi:hypothetical protein